MAWVLRWKVTAAMAASYAAAAAAVMFILQDATTAAAALVILFALTLLAGNMYAKQKGGRVEGWKGGRGRAAPLASPLHPSTPPPLRPDPETRRR